MNRIGLDIQAAAGATRIDDQVPCICVEEEGI